MPDYNQNRGYRNNRKDNKTDDRFKNLSQADKLIIQTSISGRFDDETIKFANEFGRYLKNTGLTTTQFRNIYGEVKRIEEVLIRVNADAPMEQKRKTKKDFLMLLPKIAYTAKRAEKRNNAMLGFSKVLEIAINTVKLDDFDKGEKDRFENFSDFLQAILAYHKAAGAKD